MPIRPEFRHYYRGRAWREIRMRISRRAGDKCEQCTALNRQLIVRAGDMWAYYSPRNTFSPQPGVMDAFAWRNFHGEALKIPADERPTFRQARVTTVQCGVAHLDHDPTNNADRNLKFLCRRCHLIHDKGKHKESRSTRKDSERPLLAEARA